MRILTFFLQHSGKKAHIIHNKTWVPAGPYSPISVPNKLCDVGWEAGALRSVKWRVQGYSTAKSPLFLPCGDEAPTLPAAASPFPGSFGSRSRFGGALSAPGSAVSARRPALSPWLVSKEGHPAPWDFTLTSFTRGLSCLHLCSDTFGQRALWGYGPATLIALELLV